MAKSKMTDEELDALLAERQAKREAEELEAAAALQAKADAVSTEARDLQAEMAKLRETAAQVKARADAVAAEADTIACTTAAGQRAVDKIKAEMSTATPQRTGTKPQIQTLLDRAQQREAARSAQRAEAAQSRIEARQAAAKAGEPQPE